MAVTAGIPGRKANLTYDATSTGSGTAFGVMQNYSLDVTRELADQTNFDSSGWTEMLDGRRSWSFSAQTIHVSTLANLSAIRDQLSTTAPVWYTIQPTTSDTQNWEGYALVTSYSISVADDNSVHVLNFSAQGTQALNYTS